MAKFTVLSIFILIALSSMEAAVYNHFALSLPIFHLSDNERATPARYRKTIPHYRDSGYRDTHEEEDEDIVSTRYHPRFRPIVEADEIILKRADDGRVGPPLFEVRSDHEDSASEIYDDWASPWDY